jgi:crossover junction endodeoxyribonuclease RusA
MPHLEFVVHGPPISYQTRDKANLRAWQAKIKSEAARTWTLPPLTGKLKFIAYNVHEGEEPSVDDDNMVKPIRDALNKLVYEDDRQIRQSETYHIPIDDPIKIRGASAIFLAAYSKGDEFVYIRIEDAHTVLQIPG